MRKAFCSYLPPWLRSLLLACSLLSWCQAASTLHSRCASFPTGGRWRHRLRDAGDAASTLLLIRMVQEKIPHNTTFLMPNDRLLSTASIPENQVLDFLSRHSIPAPLMLDDLIRLPNGTIVPTHHSSQIITITSREHQKLYFNNVELSSPDVCRVGDLFRCHGINAVIRPAVRGRGLPCPRYAAPTGAAPEPASAANQSLETSSLTSPNLGSATGTALEPAAERPQSSDTSTSQLVVLYYLNDSLGAFHFLNLDSWADSWVNGCVFILYELCRAHL